jgi:hypothetical protein
VWWRSRTYGNLKKKVKTFYEKIKSFDKIQRSIVMRWKVIFVYFTDDKCEASCEASCGQVVVEQDKKFYLKR